MKADAQRALVALLLARQPLAPDAGPVAAMSDPAVSAEVDGLAAALGRRRHALPDGRVTLVLDDDIARQLAARPHLGLPRTQAAVLALVLLHTVLIPRSRGGTDDGTLRAEKPVSRRQLVGAAGNPNLTKTASKQATTALLQRGALQLGAQHGLKPGPALLRLSDQQRQRIDEHLLCLCAPTSAAARRLATRRAATGDPLPPAITPLGETEAGGDGQETS